ncbi:hypothetical protein [Paraburkholderia bannensis]|uniref:hypothetical protein n=1 Tax=Paraburkholderia bannensis TaxID=765414 RepID=UPI0005A97668|nr:hypothetical protein [Paraburkholderia bannensis]
MVRKVEMVGRRFGRLRVTRQAQNIGRDVAWSCVCDCGEALNVRGAALRRGNTSSCGCLHREQLIARNQLALARTTKTHGMSSTRTFRIWVGMRRRCADPRIKCFRNYGGRGVRVCERWASFENFLADMGEAPAHMSIDRIDVNGNYEPGNCRWATPAIQSRNKRDNFVIAFGGTTQCLTDWAADIGVSVQTLHSRLRDGWSVEQALSLPVRKGVPLKARGAHV